MRMFKGLSEDLNSIKIDPVRKNGYIIEIKNNLQGINSKVDEAKNQINDLEHKEANKNKDKNKSEQHEEKRI